MNSSRRLVTAAQASTTDRLTTLTLLSGGVTAALITTIPTVTYTVDSCPVMYDHNQDDDHDHCHGNVGRMRPTQSGPGQSIHNGVSVTQSRPPPFPSGKRMAR